MPTREHVRHEMAIRRLSVSHVEQVTPSIVRVTFIGDALNDFSSPGPTDHVKVFFPDPANGKLTVPELRADGIHRPTDGVIISRDYTPRQFRPAPFGAAELDIDFVLHSPDHAHGNPTDPAGGGPASAWAAAAKPGDEVAIGGPRGSRLAPQDVTDAVLIADETALPSLTRWLDTLPESARITALIDAADEEVEPYLTEEQAARASVEWLYRIDGPGQLDEAVRSLTLPEGVYVWAAGEASTLIPVRRYLKQEAGLQPDQLDVQGYWKRGVVNRDHHEPLDPSDPD
ncbi:siderophore-interacting protein [Humibacter ginsenosidimutans]|uniref:Siderophore-interacting protein n=1 Tax=Humibacter ginsenosidimutans TaxID=2599293 RepID=A0A5B8M8D7_9MICO|nr:siderophore-interacting protein [Humibacter ginsenosidimutans]QDZ15690.1 siderophore-interacting protein [Humibacter ginsenosidimutans]